MFKGILRFALNDVGCLQGFRNCLELLFHAFKSFTLFYIVKLSFIFSALLRRSLVSLGQPTQNSQVRNDCLNCHPEGRKPFMMICRRIPLNMQTRWFMDCHKFALQIFTMTVCVRMDSSRSPLQCNCKHFLHSP